jgi:hypothetical protein
MIIRVFRLKDSAEKKDSSLSLCFLSKSFPNELVDLIGYSENIVKVWKLSEEKSDTESRMHS